MSQLNTNHRGITRAHFACKSAYTIDSQTCCYCTNHGCKKPYRYVRRNKKLSKVDKTCRACWRKGYYTKTTGGNLALADFEDTFYSVPLKIVKIPCPRCNNNNKQI